MKKKTRKDYWVTVCDKCLRASCWHGEFVCDESHVAGTAEKKASELKKLNREHPSWFSAKRLLEGCGEVRCCED